MVSLLDSQPEPRRILLVDDDPDFRHAIYDHLRQCGFQVEARSSAQEALAVLSEQDFDVVVADVELRDGLSGVQLCERIVANRPHVPVVVVTAYGNLDTAIAALRVGAYDFLPKPFQPPYFVARVERAIQHKWLRAQLERFEREAPRVSQFEEIVGASPPMRTLFDLLARAASSEASCFVTGESGTGKELVARALHRRSRRAERPFVAVNCAAMPEPLLESELFGHVRGAFTDARSDRQGLILNADGGTLFLDEIGDMPPGLQAKLLRVLQERTVRRVGDNREIPFDVRVMAATNRDIDGAVDEGRFREDLYFRINVIHVSVPPLRSRGADVLLLAEHFLARFASDQSRPIKSLSHPAAERLLNYEWPGNVRELRNCLERAVALAGFERILVEDLPEKIRRYQASHVILAGHDPAELVPMSEVERRYITRVLEAVRGNKSEAARILGYDRKTLYRKIERYRIELPDED
jgi:two-component system response regulator HydG